MNMLDHLGSLVSGKVNIIKKVFALVHLEAKLAGMSIFPLILNITMLLVVITTLWLSLMILIGHFALLYLGNFLFALILIMAINLVLLFSLFKYLSYNLTNMSFKHTRALFSPPREG